MAVPLRYKIVLPFVFLLAFVGIAGTAASTLKLANAATSEFDDALFRSGVLANDQLARVESDRLAELRELTDTVGVPDALVSHDTKALTRLLGPIAMNEQPAKITLHVLDRLGDEVLRITGTTVTSPPGTEATSYRSLQSVQDVLAGQHDEIGERNLFLVGGTDPSISWIGPIKDDANRIQGAIIEQEPLKVLAAGIPDVVFYDVDGNLLASSAQASPALPSDARQIASRDHPTRLIGAVGAHQYGQLFSDWTMRGRQLGYLAVVHGADHLLDSVNQARAVLVLVFTAAAILTLIAAGLVVSQITRPVDDLVAAMRAVSTGDLSARARRRSHDEIGYLATVFNQTTASLQEKTRELEETAFTTIETLARAIDARDAYTYGHSRRVAAISLEIAEALNVPADQRLILRRAALLHDIGKIGVEDRLLRKKGRLSRKERDAMQRHSVIGYEMLRDLRFLNASLNGIRNHHESWDGSGYPDGLRAERIPLFVRILSVADVLDAITSDRPYRERLTLEQAMVSIRQEAGKRFDPQVVEALADRFEAVRRIVRGMGKARTIKPREHARKEAA